MLGFFANFFVVRPNDRLRPYPIQSVPACALFEFDSILKTSNKKYFRIGFAAKCLYIANCSDTFSSIVYCLFF